jgi:hypothetical protein
MEDKPTFRPFLFPTLFLLLGGWGGLALLLNFSVPTLWARWGFFALLILAGTGTIIPISYWLNTHLSSNPGRQTRAIVRQSVSVGVYLALLAWLEIGRVLNLSITVWLALGLAAIEYLVRLRENSSKPENVSPRSSGS